MTENHLKGGVSGSNSLTETPMAAAIGASAQKKGGNAHMEKNVNGTDRQAAQGRMRLLLVVDGDVSSSFYTSILLQRLEYNIYSAKTAEDALEIMGMTAPALILTEIALPRMSGIEFLKLVKRTPEFGPIPVIIHTENKKPEYEELCRQAGCAEYLRKPADPNTLYAAIQSATEPTPRRVIRLKTSLCMYVEDETDTQGVASGECITYLSENGLFISTAKPQPTGTALPIIFSLRNITIRVEAIVLYSYSKRSRPTGEHGMGLKFLNISPEDKELIRTFILEQLTRNIAPPGEGAPPL
jgi:CheY-like chemotaxis protein